jgi:hypothetical protein
MSEAKVGEYNPMYGKVPVNAFSSGANHPTAVTVTIEDLKGK